jgi:hypothetical protein
VATKATKKAAKKVKRAQAPPPLEPTPAPEGSGPSM